MMPRENVKDKPHLAVRLTDAGFESCALKVYSSLSDIDIVEVDVIHGVMRFHCVQTICVSDAFAHPRQFLHVRAVR